MLGEADTIYEFAATTLDGQVVNLSDYSGKVVIIVNTASQCGLTPQYGELEAIWIKYRERGLVILGFPCNQFRGQEPGSNAEIRAFCERNYGVSFPLFAKIDVNGSETHPLFRHLKSAKPGFLGNDSIKWNFTKFLVDRKGRVVARYAPVTPPKKMEKAIVRLLDQQ